MRWPFQESLLGTFPVHIEHIANWADELQTGRLGRRPVMCLRLIQSGRSPWLR